MINADNITDEQIDQLYSDKLITSLTRTIAKRLMRGPRVGASAYEEKREREYCAEILNARARAKCPGQQHRNHNADVCGGSCCTACGGPIDDNSECRCES